VEPRLNASYNTKDLQKSQSDRSALHLDSVFASLDICMQLAMASSDYKITLKKSYGLTLEHMLIKCTFDEQNCEPTDFVWYYDNNFGNCYKYNSGFFPNGSIAPVKQVVRVGRQYGCISIYLAFFEINLA
jgi:hypothetical protein